MPFLLCVQSTRALPSFYQEFVFSGATKNFLEFLKDPSPPPHSPRPFLVEKPTTITESRMLTEVILKWIYARHYSTTRVSPGDASP